MPSELHQHLIEKGKRWLTNQGCGVVMADTVAWTATGEQPDLIAWRSGDRMPVSIVIEAKVSRQDFARDQTKRIRDDRKGMGDWRFYLTPKGLLSVDELPQGWGLIELAGQRILKTQGVPANTQWATRNPFEGNKATEMEMLYSGLRRHQSG